MQIPKFIPQIDYLRGVAVLAVMLYHGSRNVHSFDMARYCSFGWVGVDLFFVLSGFLITGILLNTRDSSNYFQSFYVRRILRIWPLYFALLGTMLVVLPRVLPSEGAVATSTARPVLAFLFFVQNLAVSHQILGPLGVTWSLAIEEQYYFVWPLLVWVLPRRSIKWISIGIILASPAVRLFLHLSGVHMDMYTNTFTRLDGLAVGSFLAVWLRNADPVFVRRIALILLPVCAAASIAVQSEWIQYSFIALMFGSVLCLSLSLKLDNRLIRYTGQISYGLYLLHLIAFDLARHEHLRRWYPSGFYNDLAYLLVGFLLCYAFASASWYLLESRCLLLKDRFSTTAPTKSVIAKSRAVAGGVSLTADVTE